MRRPSGGSRRRRSSDGHSGWGGCGDRQPCVQRVRLRPAAGGDRRSLPQPGVPLLVDASQSAGTCCLHLTELGAAFIAMPGHKGLYGPQGTGLLLCGERPARPLLLGGTGSASRDRQMPP